MQVGLVLVQIQVALVVVHIQMALVVVQIQVALVAMKVQVALVIPYCRFFFCEAYLLDMYEHCIAKLSREARASRSPNWSRFARQPSSPTTTAQEQPAAACFFSKFKSTARFRQKARKSTQKTQQKRFSLAASDTS